MKTSVDDTNGLSLVVEIAFDVNKHITMAEVQTRLEIDFTT